MTGNRALVEQLWCIAIIRSLPFLQYQSLSKCCCILSNTRQEIIVYSSDRNTPHYCKGSEEDKFKGYTGLNKSLHPVKRGINGLYTEINSGTETPSSKYHTNEFQRRGKNSKNCSILSRRRKFLVWKIK